MLTNVANYRPTADTVARINTLKYDIQRLLDNPDLIETSSLMEKTNEVAALETLLQSFADAEIGYADVTFGQPSDAIQAWLAVLPADTQSTRAVSVLSTKRSTLLDFMKFTHLLNLSYRDSSIVDMKTFFDAAAPTPKVIDVDKDTRNGILFGDASNVLSVQEVAGNVISMDGFTIPATKEISGVMMDVMQLFFLYCKRATVEHISKRIGCVRTSSNVTNCTNNTFDSATDKACHDHIKAVAEIIQSKVPFALDNKDITNHMSMCMGLITSYCRTVAEGVKNRGSSSSSSSLGTATMSTIYAIPMAQTNIIFNITSSVPIEQIIYYCMSPWLRLLFVSTFVSSRQPVKFSDAWQAQYIILLSGYLISDVFTLIDASEYAKMKAAVATHMNAMSKAYTELQTLYNDTVSEIQSNAKESSVLGATSANIDFRRQNLEAMVIHYQQAQKRTAAAKWWFYASVCVVAALVVGIGALIALNMSFLAILVAGLVLLAIIVYTLTKFFVQTLHSVH
jgi:hypothetical protein